MANKEIFKYVPFKSCIHPTFWYKLSEIKIDIDGLNDKPRKIFGFYTNSNAVDNLLEVDFSSFNENFNPPKNNFVSHGILINKNTIEDFKNCDKVEIINNISKSIWENVENGNALKDLSLLSNFVILSFADLKKHNYYYWFAFPTPSNPIAYTTTSNHQTINNIFNKEQLNQLQSQYFSISDASKKCFFLLELNNNSKLNIHFLETKINPNETLNNFADTDLTKIYFCYADSCEFENSGWILRNYIAFLVKLCPSLCSKTINIISIRNKSPQNLENSILFEIIIPIEDVKFDDVEWIGWELNDNGKMGPRISAMANSMDPQVLAASSVNLNLKLMKWRLLPELDLKKISNTKCLLFGCGTLGCGVARTLMSWGVENITFIDYGTVSYSNPIRQSLYQHADAIGGGKKKALVAAERVKEIHPGIKSKGYSLLIPMAGHAVGESMLKKTLENINLINELISTHDVLFLLTDSRESRWLPTLLGAHHDKIVMNAALGFDSYLVMRHGSRKTITDDIKNVDIPGLKCIPGNKLGCYFCNDVTAPGNSMKDRTLDQQCTVTRPAVSNIASSLVVELMISIIQHKDKNLAPSYISTTNIIDNDIDEPEGILGILPHSIRGMLSTYSQILPATEKFFQCIACSENVLTEYKKNGNEFILKVLESSKYLEDLTGLSEMMSMESDIIAIGCDDDYDVSD